MSNSDRMDPVSGQTVETDGVYANEWGREESLKRGDLFPADPMLGNTEWKLTELVFDNHHEGRTDPRLVPKEDDVDKRGKLVHPRRHIDSGDK